MLSLYSPEIVIYCSSIFALTQNAFAPWRRKQKGLTCKQSFTLLFFERRKKSFVSIHIVQSRNWLIPLNWRCDILSDFKYHIVSLFAFEMLHPFICLIEIKDSIQSWDIIHNLFSCTVARNWQWISRKLFKLIRVLNRKGFHDNGERKRKRKEVFFQIGNSLGDTA